MLTLVVNRYCGSNDSIEGLTAKDITGQHLYSTTLLQGLFQGYRVLFHIGRHRRNRFVQVPVGKFDAFDSNNAVEKDSVRRFARTDSSSPQRIAVLVLAGHPQVVAEIEPLGLQRVGEIVEGSFHFRSQSSASGTSRESSSPSSSISLLRKALSAPSNFMIGEVRP